MDVKIARALAFVWVLAFMITYLSVSEGYRYLVILIYGALGSALAFQISFKKTLVTLLYVTLIAVLICMWWCSHVPSVKSFILYLTVFTIVAVAVSSWIRRPKYVST
ncbi:MAG TPA: hypothetical protein ENF75_05950 [Acidilobales archaeon]|nr:MAG: hypothetical protein B6U85_09590 [Desulfurococcales archaeon ex4484_42]HDD26613.1 hypothetical protein [Acidilobales archaeon]